MGSLLAERGYQVIPRAQLKERLLAEKKASFKQCYDSACQIEIGKELAAQKSLATQVIKLGKSCKVTLTLYDLKRAASERAGTVSGECDEDGVVASLENAVVKMFKETQAAVMAPAVSAAPGASEYESLAAKLKSEKEALEKAWAAVKEIAGSEGMDKGERARLLRKFVADFPRENPYQKKAIELAEFLETRNPPGLVWVFSTPAAIEFTKSEITVAQYRACVEAGKCTPAHFDDGTCAVYNGSSWGKGKLPESFRGDSQPVVCVDWHQATAFCEWAGGRLPTEQEWEKEASNMGSRKYPWGNEEPTCGRVVMYQGGDGCGNNSTWPVCSKPAGNSASGLCDMSGNVWEWTSSAQGSKRVLRGGSWYNDYPDLLRASNRFRGDPSSRSGLLGFRCGRASP